MEEHLWPLLCVLVPHEGAGAARGHHRLHSYGAREITLEERLWVEAEFCLKRGMFYFLKFSLRKLHRDGRTGYRHIIQMHVCKNLPHIKHCSFFLYHKN